jgi:hypothetical protein
MREMNPAGTRSIDRCDASKATVASCSSDAPRLRPCPATSANQRELDTSAISAECCAVLLTFPHPAGPRTSTSSPGRTTPVHASSGRKLRVWLLVSRRAIHRASAPALSRRNLGTEGSSPTPLALLAVGTCTSVVRSEYVTVRSGASVQAARRARRYDWKAAGRGGAAGSASPPAATGGLIGALALESAVPFE